MTLNIRWPESVSKWYALRHPLRMRKTIEIVVLARLHDWIEPKP